MFFLLDRSLATSTCEKGGRWEQALILLGQMQKAGVPPDVVSFSAATSACEEGGQWQQALVLFGPLPKPVQRHMW